MDNLIFTWAEDSTGKLVHIDSVCRGQKCDCFCPNCHEPLIARHGDVREHGFAHQSKMRSANLKKCYQVIRYKLAEQIIQQRKRVQAPSYYLIFREKELVFEEVTVDNRYNREDRQPDVIAKTSDGSVYLIEFTFKDRVRHHKSLDYNNLNCLEIDLSKQSLEGLESFLLSSTEDRKWLNNQTYFNNIEAELQ